MAVFDQMFSIGNWPQIVSQIVSLVGNREATRCYSFAQDLTDLIQDLLHFTAEPP